MIKITQLTKINGHSAYEFECPHCGLMITFHYTVPNYCQYCYETLPNALGLIRETDQRIIYHIVGED